MPTQEFIDRHNQEREERRNRAIAAGRTPDEISELDAFGGGDFEICYYCGEAILDGYCQCDALPENWTGRQVIEWARSGADVPE